jgi:hypothetical protein
MTRMYFIGTVLNLMSMILSTVLNLAFALSVLGFLIMHMSLVAGNTTTIEVSFFSCLSYFWLFLFYHSCSSGGCL